MAIRVQDTIVASERDPPDGAATRYTFSRLKYSLIARWCWLMFMPAQQR